MIWACLFLFSSRTTIGEEPAPFIRDIQVKGHYPFLTKQVLRLLSLQPGDRYDAFKIDENKKRIQEYFEKQGNYDTVVRTEAVSDKKYPAIILHIFIEKGHSYRIGRVNVEGNTVLNTLYIKNKLASWTHFSTKKLGRQLKKIQEKYIKKGFVRARITDVVTHFNESNKTVDINLTIEERKKLNVHFMGNHWFKSSTLKNYVSFYKDRGYSNFAAEKSLEQIKDFYLRNGFAQITINYFMDRNLNDDITVTYEINEGPRTRTKNIIFENNIEVSDKKLRSSMTLEEHSLLTQGLYDERLLLDDPARIKKYYQSQGYLNADVESVKQSINSFQDQVTVHIDVHEGKAYALSSVNFSGNTVFKNKTLFKKSDLSLNKTFTLKEKNRAFEKILTSYLKRGYAYVKIDFEEVRNDTDGLIDLTVNITEGPKVYFGQVTVEGNFITQDKTILSALKFKARDRYTYDTLLVGQLNLKRLGIFDYVSVTPVGLDDEKEVVDVIVKVTERKHITLDIQAGFDSDKLASGQLIFTRRNLFGLGKQLQIRGVGGFEYDRGEITFLSPRLFGASWNLANQYFIEYRDEENFNAWSYGGSIGTLKNFGNDWTLLLKTQLTRFNIFENESNQEAFEDNLFDSTFSETSASVVFDSRDNFSDPQKGFYSLFSTEFNTDLSDVSNTFNITQFNLSHYIGFFNRFTLINTFRVGKIFEIAQEPRIPASKLFFLGGNDTLRGFDEDVVVAGGGTTSLLYNGELSFRVFGAFKLAGFVDVGSLTSTFSDIRTDTFRESAGLGLRYITPVGPIRVDYGVVLDKRENEKGSRFHFSFGGFF